MEQQIITVGGMTCQNCVRHVTAALESLPGVRSVQVDLGSGTAQLQAEAEIPRAAIASALDEAGYSLS